MDQDKAVAMAIRTLIQFGLLKEDDKGWVREHLNRLYVAGLEQGRKEIHVNHTTKVTMYDKFGTELETYNTVVEAARKMNCGKAGIYSAIYRGAMTRNGYYWKYKKAEGI